MHYLCRCDEFRAFEDAMHVSGRTFLQPRLYRVNALRDVHCWDG